MKFITVPILCLLILTQTFSKWLILIEYNINKDYISKNLCVNRMLPKMHCNGKCQLMKKLAEEEKQNNPFNEHSGKVKSADVLFSNAIYSFSIESLPEIKQQTFFNYISSVCTEPHRSVFHPPAVA